MTDWSVANAQHRYTPLLRVLLYLAFLLPLFGPLARWTHLQISVIVFVAPFWTLYRIGTGSQELAFSESAVV
jgi:hypothetical protein